VLGNVSFLVEIVLVQSLVATPIILMTLDRAADPERRIRLRRLLALLICAGLPTAQNTFIFYLRE
jgi:hypothetical protein